MTETPKNATSQLTKFLCFPFYSSKHSHKKISDTKAYIIAEHPDGWGGVPQYMDKILVSLFSSREKAEEYLRRCMGYFYSSEERKLFFEDGKARDEHGTYFYQIVEKRLNK